ncbi:MAG: four helix bundle protein [Crocinitomicaceae bacterium]|nr:four helix bundle protein [Crocinitomicaceae bacterium]
MHNFRNMTIWKRSMDLSKKILILTNDFPKENRFDITSHIIRSTISIPSNIAEGSSRRTSKEFSMFIDYSIGSAHELETQLLLAAELGLADCLMLNQLINELVIIQKMLVNFKKGI